MLLLFNQLKFLANYFKIPFNFDENVINKKELNLWLDNAKFNDKLFKEILKDMPELEEDCLELLKRLLCFNPKERISAKDALKMPYFQCYQKFNKEEI
jgi:serine/threonine protein kinase